MKYVKRISLIVVAVLVLACSVPFSSLAVDPVSAATMANALAQAITAYGASQGVSMTFDVANTDGIGEGVHELWDQYQADMANSSITVSDYQNLAASAFPTLWIKIGEKIGVNLDAASVGEIDGFWNWLLSGPAEMTKVDNQYFEWSVDQQTDSVLPISVYVKTPLGSSLPTVDSNFTVAQKYDAGMTMLYRSNRGYYRAYEVNGYETYIFYTGLNNGTATIYGITPDGHSNTFAYAYPYGNSFDSDYGVMNTSVTVNGINYYYGTKAITSVTEIFIPYFTDVNAAIQAYNNYVNNGIGGEDISVQPYVGDTVPQNVYIPDNTDVNYEPIPASIPTDITWDDALFGDGTGTLTDAQSEAITQTVDQVIIDNPAKTLELADPATPPAPSPSEVYIPFLPVTLPSFQFSLSGIWHYVTAWVTSLGAWFSLVFTTWSYLPFAISVPVYATAVIVIVLGVYKRFFM